MILALSAFHANVMNNNRGFARSMGAGMHFAARLRSTKQLPASQR